MSKTRAKTVPYCRIGQGRYQAGIAKHR